MPGTKRKMVEEPNIPVLSPNEKTYEQHVSLRTFVFITLLYAVAELIKKFQPSTPYTKYMADHALVQYNKGIYAAKRAKIDAAHYCNTSFKPGDFIANAVNPLSPAAYHFVDELEKFSASTSYEEKTANVAPDKVIDLCQTNFKNLFLNDLQKKGVPMPINQAYTQYLTDVQSKLNAKSVKIPSSLNKSTFYKSAINAITNQISTPIDDLKEIELKIQEYRAEIKAL